MRKVKIIAIICCLFLVFDTAVAQDTIIPDGRRWVMREYRPLYPPYGNRITICHINGDTLINGHRYSKLYQGSFECMIRREGTKWYVYDYIHEERISRDTLLFDESLIVGDTAWIEPYENEHYIVSEIGEIQGRKYWNVYDCYTWVQDVGWVTHFPFKHDHSLVGGVSVDVICCVDPGNDTLYVNRDLLYLLETGVENISADEISFTQRGGECVVTLPADVAAWEATLSNSVGVTVARSSGEGCEIILPATSKGTHILVINVGGRVVKKKVYIK